MNKQYAIFPSARKAEWALAAAVAALTAPATAQLNVAAVNTAYSITFDATVSGVSNGAWAGTGFQPAPAAGRLDSDAWAATGWSDGTLAFGGTQVTAGTDFRRGTTAPGNGAIASGGMYSFGGAGITGRALGFQPGAADWAPGSITLRVQNNSGSTLTAFDIAYNVYYRNDQNSSSAFNLYYSDDNVNYTAIPSQDVTSPDVASGTAWVANARNGTANGVYVPNGQYFYIRWRGFDVSVSGARDEFALDDISVTGRVNTMVRLTSTGTTVSESIGTHVITASITNPDPVNPTSVDLVLSSGPGARVNGFTTQTLTFPGGSVANENVTVTITDNGACDGNATTVFTLQNIAGGMGTSAVGIPAAYSLVIDDDETDAATWAQAFDGGVGDTWNVTAGGANVSSTPGATDTPANQRILSPANSWQVRNAVVTLDLASVDITDWTSILLSARVSSTSLSASDGADAADSIAFYVALNGGAFPSDPDIRIAGNSNARWGYSTGTGIALTTAGTPANYMPGAGGNRTTDGYSTVRITVPDGTTSVALRVIAKNNTGNELWNVDNVQITGTLCTPIYYSRANGSETTPTWSTARTGVPAPAAVTFNKNRSMVVQAGHTVTTTTNATINVRNYTVETGGAMALGGVTSLTANGPTFKADGSFTAADDNVALKYTGLTTITGTSGTIDVNDLTCDGGGVLVSVNTVKVRGTLQLDKGNFNANSKEVQLISTGTGTARLGPVSATASYSDRLRIERFIPAGVTDWRLLCSPMQGKTVVDWTDDFFTAGFPGSTYPNFYVNMQLWPSVRMYDETNPGPNDEDGLIGVPSSAQALTVGRGFAAWSGTTLQTTTAFTVDVRGLPTVASTPFSIPLTYTNNGFGAVDGLNLVGNPVPSPIDFGSLTLSNVDNNYYIYDPGSGTNAAWDEILQVGTGGTNGNIQSSQGFWLKANAAGPSATLGENAKVLEPINGGVFSLQDDNRPMVRLYLSDEANTRTDEALVHFIGGEAAYALPDMVKLGFANDNAQLISTKASTGEDLVINAFGELTGPVDVPVKVQVPVSGTYRIRLANVGVVSGRVCMTLEDLLTGSSVTVTEDAVLDFAIDASAPAEPARFVLHVAQPVVTSVTDPTCATSNNGTLVVNGPGNDAWTYTLLPSGGDAIVQGPMEGGATFADLSGGTYQLLVGGNTGCGVLAQDVQLTGPGLLAGEVIVANAGCPAAGNGSADLTVMGGTAPYTFDWSDGSDVEDLSAAAPGIYDVTITDGNGCSETVDNVVVGAEAGPMAAFEVSSNEVFVDDEVFYFNMGTYGLEYLWAFGDGETSTENEPTHQYELPGQYTVTLTAIDGDCSATTTHGIAVSTSTGIATAAVQGVSAWVENGQFVVQWQVAGAAGLSADILDATGRIVMQRSAKGGAGRVTMLAQELPTGVYYMRVRSGGTEQTFKLPLAR